MQRKVILIILIFLLMMNSLIGVIYAEDETNLENNIEQAEQQNQEVEQVQETTSELNDVSQNSKIENKGRQYFVLGTIIVFVFFLIIIERKLSIKILLRLIITLLILYYIYIKAIVNGKNIILFTAISTFLIAFTNIFIKEGICRKSFSELISVIITSLITGGSVAIICMICKININLFLNIGILGSFGGIIFGSATISLLGVFMDIISRITLRLDSEKDKAQDVVWKEQFKIGVNIGKEFISEKINMLILVFGGIILLPVCVYLQKGYTFIEILNLESVFVICIIAFIGTIGLVLSVPITSFIYAMFNRKKTIYKTVSENKLDGKRSLKI